MKDSNKLLIDVLDYIVQFEKLNRKPVYSLQSDIFEAYQSQLMGLPGVEFNLQIDNDDIWLKITRLKETLSPEPSEYLKPWITVSKSPDVLPILKNEIAVYENDTDIKIEKLGDYPEIQSEFDFYFSSHWKPWSVQESPKRKTIGYYNKLFTVQQEISSHSVDSPIELVWGVGFSLWSLPEKEKVVKYPLITQSCEIYLNQTTFDIEIRPRDSEPKLEIDCYEALENRGVRLIRQHKTGQKS
jgi:hypothetical protein